MSRKPLLVLIAAFVALSAVGLWLTRPDPSRQSGEAQPGAEAPATIKPDRQSRSATVRWDAGVPANEESAPPSSADANAPPPSPAAVANEANGERALQRATETAIRPGEDQPRGTVNKEAIKIAINSVKPLVRDCFTDARDRYPPPQKVTLKFTITGQGISGHFTDGEVMESTIADPWVQACFLEALVDARFPVPEEGGTVTVTYPFSFSETPPDAGVR